MLKAKELLERGQLSAAIGQVTQDVKSKPADARARVFLFELLCLSGELERAEKQLEALGHQSAEMQIGTEVYRQVLQAEKQRRAFLEEGSSPNFLVAPPPYASLRIEALALQREKNPVSARALLEQAMELEPALSGNADAQPFEEFGDSDIFLGPFLELFVNEKYAWLPFEQIRRIEIAKSKQLRDLVWARAKLEARTGDLGEVFLPVLYPGSSRHADEAVKLGRLTDWIDVGERLSRGVGQRLFTIDGQDRPMLEVHEIIFTDMS